MEVAGKRLPAAAAGGAAAGAAAGKIFFCRDFDEEFNGISFRIFGGVLDKFKNF